MQDVVFACIFGIVRIDGSIWGPMTRSACPFISGASIWCFCQQKATSLNNHGLNLWTTAQHMRLPTLVIFHPKSSIYRLDVPWNDSHQAIGDPPFIEPPYSVDIPPNQRVPFIDRIPHLWNPLWTPSRSVTVDLSPFAHFRCSATRLLHEHVQRRMCGSLDVQNSGDG